MVATINASSCSINLFHVTFSTNLSNYQSLQVMLRICVPTSLLKKKCNLLINWVWCNWKIVKVSEELQVNSQRSRRSNTKGYWD